VKTVRRLGMRHGCRDSGDRDKRNGCAPLLPNRRPWTHPNKITLYCPQHHPSGVTIKKGPVQCRTGPFLSYVVRPSDCRPESLDGAID
jgi:hypothetical protein